MISHKEYYNGFLGVPMAASGITTKSVSGGEKKSEVKAGSRFMIYVHVLEILIHSRKREREWEGEKGMEAVVKVSIMN